MVHNPGRAPDGAISRRSLLKSGASLAAALTAPGRLLATADVVRPLPGSTADRVFVADGYRYDVILRWGDPLFAGAVALDATAAARGSLRDMTPAVAEWQFGYNNDAVHCFPLEGSASRLIVCVNHEYTNEELFLPGLVRIETADPRQMADYVRRHPGIVPLTQAMHGVSIFVIERDERGRWQHVVGTFLTAEENVDYYFGHGSALSRADAGIQQAHRRMPPRAASIHGWEHVESCFDLGREPTELLRFGWIVEIDPYDPAALPKKRAANRDLLDDGVLHTARFDPDGSGRWLPLVHGVGPLTASNGFGSQADVVLRMREAADLLGATPMDRPEDVAPDAGTGRVYLALTSNQDRAATPMRGEYNGREIDLGPDAANPRGPNPFGHIVEIEEAGGDCGADAFRWGLFLAGGESAAPSRFGSPDNLALDRAGNLWIVTDGTQPGGFNNGCYVVPTRGPERGRIRQVLSAPRGAEVCGCSFTPDGATLLLSIQHPGEGGSLAAPGSQWPDGPGRVPRPSLIALDLPPHGERE
jgi:secreted PhoX family phosphatase